MAIRAEYPERFPIANVEVEYDRAGAASKTRKPGFTRVRLLGLELRQNQIELATRESLPVGEKLTFAMHVKGVRNFVSAEGEVKAMPRRITVLKQPAFSVVLQLGKLTSDQAAKMTWAGEQLAPRQRTGPVRRDEEKPAPGATPNAPKSGRDAAAAPSAASGATSVADESAPAEATPAPAETPQQIKRPVALLLLIDALHKCEVTDDLVLSILEVAEANVDVEALYPTSADDAPAVAEGKEAEASEAAPRPEGVVRPMSVYRLASNARLYFSEANLPVGPPSELIYLSRLKSPETCFAVELGTDSMTSSDTPSFKPGSILVFSTTAKVESGDFAFVRGRTGDEFAQVFLEKNEDVRIRPLNPKYHEHTMRRSEARAMCKLIGCYEDLSG